MNRRHFIGTALASLPTSHLIQSATNSEPEGVIIIYLAGGPPNIDMFDMKPLAPLEIRGEFNPINTNVPGIRICELMPKLATISDKFSIINSLDGQFDEHCSHQSFSGFNIGKPWPCFGSLITELKGYKHPMVPPFVFLGPETDHKLWSHPGVTSFLGREAAATEPCNTELMKLKVSNQIFKSRLSLAKSLNKLNNVDTLKTHQEQATGILTSGLFLDALDENKISEIEKDKYGRGSKKKVGDGAGTDLNQFIIARRLIEAGSRVVSLVFGRWDWHGNNFGQAKQYFPLLDQGLHALISDIYERQLNIQVLVWGEFGRTPKINKAAGRDHWAGSNGCLLSGPSLKTGQVIGSTDKVCAYPEDRPIHNQEVFATLYHNLGIDPEKTIVYEGNRPHHILEHRTPIEELIII